MIRIHFNDTTHVNYDELDSGIRSTVRMLRDAGFRTTDSGDGSKAEIMECAEPVPNVYMIVDAAVMVAEADRLARVLHAACRDGLLDEVHDVDGQEVPRVFIDASYNPLDGGAILALHGVSDADLKEPS